jgi:hypothetical protein
MTKIDQPTRMRDGSTADDPRLGRLEQFDEKSRRFNVGDLLDTTSLKTRSWSNRIELDQGQTSACVGNARTYDLAGSPVAIKTATGVPLDERYAQALYRLAQKYDEWPGEDYEGSSVLGGLKACQALGFIGEYRWAFTVDDWLASISRIGPSVVGTVWMNSMFRPRPSGLLEIDPASGEAGGHSYYFRRILVTREAKRSFLGRGETIRDEPLLVLRNSWGTDWGKGGEAGMWPSDYQAHLWDGGEQSVVTSAFHS